MNQPDLVGASITLFSYLLGSVLFAILVSRHKGIDIRAEGSGNPGATNVGRVLGKPVGRVVLALDIVKGVLGAGLAVAVCGLSSPWTAASGLAVVVGHSFPVWHGLRGGKGVAASVGVLLVTVPIASAASMIGYVLVKKLTGFASLGSLVGSALAALACWLPGVPITLGWMGALLLGLVVVRHASNIGRLIKGEEPRS